MGILDDNSMDPRTQGILQAAFALLQSSGATRLPVGLGEALGKAGAAGTAAYEQAKAAEVTDAIKKNQLAQAQQELAQRQALGSVDMNDPEALRRYGILTKKPEYITHAERIETERKKQAELKGMQSQTNVIAPDPQEIAQSEDQGTPPPAPVAVKSGGIFGELTKAPFPDIAAEASKRQQEVDTAQTRDPEKIRADRDRLYGMVEKRIERQDAGSGMHVVKDPSSSTGWSYTNTRGQSIKEAPPPASAAAQSVNDVIPVEHAALHGDEYLKTLPTGMAAVVKAVAEGKVDPSKAASLRYGNREAMMQRVMQYDPKYNATRVAVYKDFTSGKTAQNVTAMNTVISHMGTVNDLTDALKNGDVQLANSLVNRIRTELGKPEINNADLAIQAMGNELMRVFRQVGASEAETAAWERKFNAAKGSPAQLKGALKVGAELLQGRIDAVDDQWKRGMDTEQGFPNLLSAKSKAALERINGKPAASPNAYSDAEKEKRYQEFKRRQEGK